ncbi:MAG TPA: LuxR C-terminal-related transcriptional regulator [Ktedonobacteraceae bacterium]|nr:LuxR C-terminal-related transcriptional regulator [Ktedonobacteraceae bacterium]
MASGGTPFHSQPILPAQESEVSHGTLRLAPMWKVPGTFTPLIGREQEVAAVCALLKRSDIRLLTLLGVGGIGKTRLSLKVAGELRDYFADGICFVHLAAVSDPELVVPTIAQELGIQEMQSLPIFEQVKVALREKHFLLILDNFEQVVEVAPLLEDLLVVCPALKTVVTSRAALHVRGEQEFPVSSLSLPDTVALASTPEDRTDLIEAAGHSAAMALFVQRAQSILPTFQITPANASAIAGICVRLDGLPLAIELAAARIKLLPPQALLSRLTLRLEVLAGGLRTFPERHQTLRNALKWSYDLLDVQEQRLFYRLSVFVGGWTLEAVESVADACDAGNKAVAGTLSALDGLASLLDKSLLRRSEQTGSEDEEPRFMMLEVVREYALEVLRESGESEITRRAHAAYYLKLAEEAEPHLKGARQVEWLARLEHEQENERAALAWLIERGEAELALCCCAALWWFWRLRGYWSEARRWLETALQLAHAEEASRARARALCAAGFLAYYQDDYAVARSLLEEAVTLCRAQDYPVELANALSTLGRLLHAQDDIDAARAVLIEGESLCRMSGNFWQLSYLLRQLGHIAGHQGDLTLAETYTEEALTLARRLEDRSLIATTLVNLSGIAMIGGNLTLAATLTWEALGLARELGDKPLIANTLQNLGYFASLQGDLKAAAELTQKGLLLFRELGNRANITAALHNLGYLASLQHDLEQATAYYREGLALAQEIGNEKQMGWHLAGLAAVYAAEGQPVRAARLFGAAEKRLDVKVQMNDVERAGYDRAVQSTRARLGEQTFAVARAEGQTLTPANILNAPEPEPSTEQPAKASPTTASAKPSYPAGLTAREVEILRLVARGLTDAQVAEELVISPRTVNWHLTTIYSKIQVSSRSAATRFAIEQHLV